MTFRDTLKPLERETFKAPSGFEPLEPTGQNRGSKPITGQKPVSQYTVTRLHAELEMAHRRIRELETALENLCRSPLYRRKAA